MGAVRVCKAVLPSMRARGSGLLINISSLGGSVGLPFQGFSKAFLPSRMFEKLVMSFYGLSRRS